MDNQLKEKRDFSFGDSSVAASYDSVLVPSLFLPWAESLIDSHDDWEGKRVLDLATGTGVVAHELVPRVGPAGRIIGTDINEEMLDIARRRCAENGDVVEFINSPAHPLALPDSSVDRVVCQQGFQFFPDRGAAAAEIFRVLRPAGSVILTTWCPVAECEYFGWMCDALENLDEKELAEMMQVPFDHLPASELGEHFAAAGFKGVETVRQERDFRIDGDMDQALAVAYATPIGAMLGELSEEKQTQFRSDLRRKLAQLCTGGTAMGKMASNVLTAAKEN